MDELNDFWNRIHRAAVRTACRGIRAFESDSGVRATADQFWEVYDNDQRKREEALRKIWDEKRAYRAGTKEVEGVRDAAVARQAAAAGK